MKVKEKYDIEISRSAAMLFDNYRQLIHGVSDDVTHLGFRIGNKPFILVLRGECGDDGNSFFSVSVGRVGSERDDNYLFEHYTNGKSYEDLKEAVGNCYASVHRYLEAEKKRPYMKGSKIRSLDELMSQEFVYFDNKVVHHGWFGSLQMRTAENYIKNGRLFRCFKG